MLISEMSNDDQKRKAWYEDDEEEDASPRPSSGVKGGATQQKNIPATSVEVSMEYDGLQSLLEQVHQLYLQYFSGLERRPPNEKHAQLEKRLKTLQSSNQPEHLKFRLNTLKTQYASYRDLWERKLKEKETGRRG
jgi:hypothetical protein